jgi:hypothetical protein
LNSSFRIDKRKSAAMMRSLVHAFSFLTFMMHASCAADHGSSAILDNFNPNQFLSFSNMLGHHRKSLMTPGFPPLLDGWHTRSNWDPKPSPATNFSKIWRRGCC